MKTTSEKIFHDPVCHMMIDNKNISIEYLDQTYAFCSQQCSDRFKANPHLYVGRPGQPAPKQKRLEVIKKRKLKLDAYSTRRQSDEIQSILSTMMGVKTISVRADCVYITYDLLEITYEQIGMVIKKSGRIPCNNIAEKLKRTFINYFEEAEIDNLEEKQFHTKRGCH